jgi:hypothetical protein
MEQAQNGARRQGNALRANSCNRRVGFLSEFDVKQFSEFITRTNLRYPLEWIRRADGEELRCPRSA